VHTRPLLCSPTEFAGVASGVRRIRSFTPAKILVGEHMKANAACRNPAESEPVVKASMFAYSRVSTEEQAERRNGLEAQRAAIDAEAERRGYLPVRGSIRGLE
jgi:hypothetical protein